MKHRIEIFDGKTEDLLEVIDISISRESELAELMKWANEEDALYVYDLSIGQLATLEKWTGRSINHVGNIVQLACIA